MNILFITATRIGDAALSTGVLDHLARKYSAARFTIACGKPAAPLFAPFPQLERLIVLEKKRAIGHWLGLWARCITRRWDLVVDLRGSLTAYALWTRARLVRGRRSDTRHVVDELADLFGLAAAPQPVLWTSPAHEARADELIVPGIPGRDFVLGLGPTANWRGKEWPAERFAKLIERLTAQAGLLPGARVAVFGGPAERATAEPVLRAIPPERRIDLVGTAELPVVAACLKRCTLYVGNDSGLMHMAVAAGIPTLGLFGPGNEERYGPSGPRGAVVRTPLTPEQLMPPGFDHRNTGTLMGSLSVDAVAAAASELYIRTREAAA
jgi:ADP-heptose:LPS heptosyltransferase